MRKHLLSDTAIGALNNPFKRARFQAQGALLRTAVRRSSGPVNPNRTRERAKYLRKNEQELNSYAA